MIEISKNCRECNEALKGRSDKKFCSDQCRNTFNNRLNSEDLRLVRYTNRILKRNRRILMDLFELKKQGSVSLEVLLVNGFNFDYFTSRAKINFESEIFYCYDYGYEKISDGKYLRIRKRNIEGQ